MEDRSLAVSSRPFAAWTRATRSPFISTTTVTRPFASTLSGRAVVPIAPLVAVFSNRADGSSSAGAANAALAGIDSASTLATVTIRRYKGLPSFSVQTSPRRFGKET